MTVPKNCSTASSSKTSRLPLPKELAVLAVRDTGNPHPSQICQMIAGEPQSRGDDECYSCMCIAWPTFYYIY